LSNLFSTTLADTLHFVSNSNSTLALHETNQAVGRLAIMFVRHVHYFRVRRVG
jgi:hypothetical protein